MVKSGNKFRLFVLIPVFFILGFFIDRFFPSPPEIISAKVEPIKVEPSDWMVVTAEVKDKYGIKNVRAEIVGIETIELKQIYGNETYGIFESKWFVHSVEVGKAYTARIIAENIKGKVSYFDVEFYDDPIFCCRRQINISSSSQNISIPINTALPISQGKMRSDCGDIRFTDSRSFDAAFWTRNFSYNLPICNRFLSGWQYRIPITINNPGPSLTDYQVLVIVDTQTLISQGKMRSDCGDIRFTDSDGITLLNYWLESGCGTTNTRIWVRVPSIPASSTKTIYMYYGNPSATSLSNGNAVFEFFDDFNDNDISDWSFNMWGSNNGDIIADNNRMRLRVYKCYNVEAYKDLGYISGAINITFNWRTATDMWHEVPGWKLIQNNNVNLVDSELPICYACDQSGTNTTIINVNGQIRILFRIYQSWACNYGDHVNTYLWIDNIIIRKFSSPEPTTTTGPEETIATASSTVHVSLPSGVTSFYVYYGNPSVTSISTPGISSWPYRRPITINNTQNPNTLTDYQVLVIVDTQTLISQGKMRSDCGDIRFTDSDEVTLLPHYIYTNITNYTGLSYSWRILGCNSTRTMIRVVVPSIPANSIKTIYMYYGNSSATYNNQLNNIFSDTIGIMSATLPSGRNGLSCAPYGDSIYCFGGNNRTHSLNQIVRYNVTNNSITIMSATLPSGREFLSCAPYGDSIYCFGGYGGGINYFNQIVRYNVTSNTVTVMSATLPSGRNDLSCTPYGDSIYCFGGYDGTNYLNQIVRYNVTSNTVTTMSATLPSSRSDLSCVPYGDSIYCFGGNNGTHSLNQIVRYNVTNNSITVMSATLPSSRAALSCAPYGDSIYCFGGYDVGSLNQIVRYNVISNTITTMSATLPSNRRELSCAPYGDSIYCFGGFPLTNQIVRYALRFSSPEPTTTTGPEEFLNISIGPEETWIRISGGGGNLLITGGSGNIRIK